MGKKSINTNAQASAFGWDFQCSLALFFVSRNLKDIKRIKVEGPTEDIEIFYDNGEIVFIQAKSQLDPFSTANSNIHLENALKTLINASLKSNYSQLYYGSNISNPFVFKEFSSLFLGGPTNYSFNELNEKIKNKIIKYVNKNSKEHKLSLSQFDYNRLRMCTLPFYGDDDNTRYRYTREKLENFLTPLGVKSSVINRTFDHYQLLFYKNPSRSLSITKEKLAWPIIIFSLDENNEKFYDDYDINIVEIDAIENIYEDFIESKTIDFPLINDISNKFSDFITSGNYSSRIKSVEEFIDQHYLYFFESIFLNETLDIVTETVTKLILWKIIKKQRVIQKLRKEVGI